jgi:hypothetical protein
VLFASIIVLESLGRRARMAVGSVLTNEPAHQSRGHSLEGERYAIKKRRFIVDNGSDFAS